MIRLRFLPSLPVILFVITACASGDPVGEVEPALDAAGAPIPAWRFEFVDKDEKALGYIVLMFTTEPLGEPTCGYDYFRKAVILEDDINFDFGTDFRPAYTIFGPWLTMDLTSASCNIDHTLLGEITPEQAFGTFNLAHPLGGRSLGRFTGRPIMVD